MHSNLQRCVALVTVHQVCSELFLGKSFFVAKSMLLGSYDGESERQGNEDIQYIRATRRGTAVCTCIYLYDAMAFSLSLMQK